MVALAGPAGKRAGFADLRGSLRRHILAPAHSGTAAAKTCLERADSLRRSIDRRGGLVFGGPKLHPQKLLPVLPDSARLRFGSRRYAALFSALPTSSGEGVAAGKAGFCSPNLEEKARADRPCRCGAACRWTVCGFARKTIPSCNARGKSRDDHVEQHPHYRHPGRAINGGISNPERSPLGCGPGC